MCLHNPIVFLDFWWARPDLNQRPPDYESGALTKLSYGPTKLFYLPIVKLTFKDFLFTIYKKETRGTKKGRAFIWGKIGVR
jgi:hypothetical protein